MSASPTVYVCADLHLGHAKVAEARGFLDPDAHDNAIIDAWNRIVRKKDVVYVLGDVFRVDRVPELAGVKKLALGNHDQRQAAVYIELFSQVKACFDYADCLLTHIPVHPSQRSRWKLNVHGHTHAGHLDDDWYVPVSLEHLPRFEPVPLSALIQAWIERLGAPLPRELPGT